MKFYLAASYLRKDEMLAVKKTLETGDQEVPQRYGYWTCSSRWLTRSDEVTDRVQIAYEDHQDIIHSHAFVYIHGGQGWGGKEAELGMAIAYDKLVIIVEHGCKDPLPIFSYLPYEKIILVQTPIQAFEAMNRISQTHWSLRVHYAETWHDGVYTTADQVSERRESPHPGNQYRETLKEKV